MTTQPKPAEHMQLAPTTGAAAAAAVAATAATIVTNLPCSQERLTTTPEVLFGAEDAEPEPEEPGKDEDTERCEPAEDTGQVACKPLHDGHRSVSEGSLRTFPSRTPEGKLTSRGQACATFPKPQTAVMAKSGAGAARMRHALCVNHLQNLGSLIRELEDENLQLRDREEKLRVTNARISQRLRLLEGDPNLLRRLYRGARLSCEQDAASL